jgi:mono/diheme cytochrome c family protein
MIDTTTDAEVSAGRRRTAAAVTVSTAVTVALALFAAACSGGSGGTAPAAGSGSGSGSGSELYAANCASCHGSDLRGTERGPSHLSIVYEPNHHGDDSFRSAIAQGAGQHHWNFGDMPPVPGLDDDEVTAIIAFVRAEQQREGFEPYERP